MLPSPSTVHLESRDTFFTAYNTLLLSICSEFGVYSLCLSSSGVEQVKKQKRKRSEAAIKKFFFRMYVYPFQLFRLKKHTYGTCKVRMYDFAHVRKRQHYAKSTCLMYMYVCEKSMFILRLKSTKHCQFSIKVHYTFCQAHCTGLFTLSGTLQPLERY